MEIINPNFIEPIDAIAAQMGPKIAAYLADRAGQKVVSLEELIAALPADQDKLTPDIVAYVAQKNGWQIVWQ